MFKKCENKKSLQRITDRQKRDLFIKTNSQNKKFEIQTRKRI